MVNSFSAIRAPASLSELADETDSKSVVGNRVWVRVPQLAVDESPESLYLYGSPGCNIFQVIKGNHKSNHTII